MPFLSIIIVAFIVVIIISGSSVSPVEIRRADRSITVHNRNAAPQPAARAAPTVEDNVKPVLFLLPGLLCDASVWAHQIAALGAAHDIRIADFTRHASIEAMAETVLAAGPARFAVAGHSMGARVALEIIRAAPERVTRLALLDTGTHPVQPDEPAKRQRLVDLARDHGMEALADQWLPPMVHPQHLADPAFMAGLRAMVARMSPEIFRRQVQALLTRPDAATVLPLITCKVLIGVGRQDAWSPPSQHEAMAAVIPQSRYVVFEESGHMAPLEAPTAVSTVLQAWLDG